MSAHQFLFQHVSFLLFFLDLPGLLCVLVYFDDPDDSDQFDDSYRPGGRPRCLRLRGQLCQGGAVLGVEDLIAEEVDI